MCKAGSAIDMKKPSTNPKAAIIHTLFVLAMKLPMKCPIGLIPMLTPKRNKDIPTTIKKEPITNLIMSHQLNETNRKFSTRTSTAIGITENRTSLSFSVSKLKVSLLILRIRYYSNWADIILPKTRPALTCCRFIRDSRHSKTKGSLLKLLAQLYLFDPFLWTEISD